ncbi:thiol reductase thioredoxin [Acidovorax carolinensis]|uniref:Thiol reductase thioredoxin n=1 Tax=Acidovorax carolinensis TaxID=553814 RepID=A0A240UDL0_9BURK|nr:thioredoxin family protein [Acidovorax carolinensis]ART54731.1 thiol reductase thioredoxin [Acidovorax carolinensis]ART59577.1 thiol reductase thioredoxin [Acidovorax carolinensis]
MPYAAQHLAQAPTRAEVDSLTGIALLEFGTPWCGHCQRAQPLIEQALNDRPDVAHVKVEDGPGQRLGRSFGVKLWPTLVLMRDGQEVARVVRPQDARAMAQLLGAGPAG